MRQDIRLCIKPELCTGQRLFRVGILLCDGNLHFLPLIFHFCRLCHNRRVLPFIGKRHCLLLSVQHKAVRRFRLHNAVSPKRKVCKRCFPVPVCCHGSHQLAGRIFQDAVPIRIFLEICRINILCSIYCENCPGKVFLFIRKAVSKAVQHFTTLHDADLPFHRMVFINRLDDDIPGNAVHLVGCIRVNGNFNIIPVKRIPVRRIHFLDPVAPCAQVLRQDQVSVFIRKIRLMPYRHRIGCHLLHISVITNVINLKFCIFHQHRSLCLIILFDDLELCRKFIVKQHPPHLRRVRAVFRDPDCKIFYRLIVMRRCRLTDDIRAVWQRCAAGIAFFIREDFRLPVTADHNRVCRIEIIIPVRFFC